MSWQVQCTLFNPLIMANYCGIIHGIIYLSPLFTDIKKTFKILLLHRFSVADSTILSGHTSFSGDAELLWVTGTHF